MDLYLKPTVDGGEIEILPNGDPRTTQGLFTAAYISLFSDPYWGNSVSDISERYQSQLNSIFQQSVSNQTRLDVIEAAKDALRWMLDENIASRIDVIAEIETKSRINVKATIYEPSGESVQIAYALNWQGQEVEPI